MSFNLSSKQNNQSILAQCSPVWSGEVRCCPVWSDAVWCG